MTSQTAHRQTPLQAAVAAQSCHANFALEIKLFCFHFVTVAIICQNRNSSAAALSSAYARNTLHCCGSLKLGPILEV